MVHTFVFPQAIAIATVVIIVKVTMGYIFLSIYLQEQTMGYLFFFIKLQEQTMCYLIVFI